MFTIRHFHSFDPGIERRLGRMEEALDTIIVRLSRMAIDLSRIETEVSENSTVLESARTLLASIVQQLRDAAAADEAQIQAKVTELADKLDAQTNALAEAVQANTPAEPGAVTG